ncbi:MAG: S8 family serine peptidase [Chloroflexi bacterium]|nr:S8 family serine peptidase [Chloroflexota bacterium]
MNRGKVAKSLLAEMEGARSTDRLAVIVVFHHTAKAPLDVRSFAKEVPVHRTCELVPSCALRATASEIAALTFDRRIAAVWPDRLVHSCLDRSAPRIQAPTLWSRGLTGKGVRIGFVDSGVDEAHPDFRGRILAASDLTGEGPGDGNGHGTHVAGIAAGAGQRFRGVAPGAALVVAKALHRDGSGYSSEVMTGLEWALRQGARVINLSIGSPGPGDGRDPLSQAVDAAARAGAVVCVAAGNDGPGESTIGAPGVARLALTVGAVTRDDRVADFSSRGPTADGRPKPDIVAPGEGIVSARASGTAQGTVVDQHYVASSGSSMATPHVSGALALLFELLPTLTGAEARDLVIASANPGRAFGPVGSTVGDRNAVGSGLLDAATAAARAADAGHPPPDRRRARMGCLESLRLTPLLQLIGRAGQK